VHNLVVFGKVQYLSVGWYSFNLGDIRYRMERDISYLGGALMLPVFWAWLMISSGRWKRLFLISAAAAAWSILLVVKLGATPLFGAAYLSCAAMGAWILYRCLTFFRGRKQGSYRLHEPLLIAAFCLIYFVVLNVMPSASMRYVLPMAPFGLLVLGEDLFLLSRIQKRWFLMTALGTSIVVSCGLAIGDYVQGNADRTLPALLKQKGYRPETTWYFGRLSYAWYLYHAGFRNLRADTLRPGPDHFLVDEVIPGDYNAVEVLGNGYSLRRVDTIESATWPLRTRGFGAGFYGEDRLPYSVALNVPQKRYYVYRIDLVRNSP
jgi:hypothetical protein